MTLDDLGPRICIIGPSNSGKSTLADAIRRARGLPAIHLDRLHHLPHTDWQPRPPADFAALHDAAILGERWVIDGNYSRLMPQRLARATGLIRLDVPTHVSLLRYLHRCWFERHRKGGLDGGRDSVKWDMIHHILGPTRANRRRYATEWDAIRLPGIALLTPAALDRFYRDEGLAPTGECMPPLDISQRSFIYRDNKFSDKEHVMSVDVKYSTRATATGGRDGAARAEDGRFEAKLSTPRELGGAGGEGTNPEQLFAAGYAACFIGALKVAGQQLKLKVPDTTEVTATVGIGPRAAGGFGITADLDVALPGLDRADAERLVETAHQICPYSNATRGNLDVGLTVA